MDITDTLAPASDQLDAVELVSGPRTFEIERVTAGKDDQPVNVHLVGFPRPWRPGKSMRRVLAACWGSDASQWPGRRVTLYCDPNVTFGADRVGGTRISHLSHIDKPREIPLIVKRGKSAVFTVQPLTEGAPPTKATKAQVDEIRTRVQALELDDSTKAAVFARAAGRSDVTPGNLTGPEAAAIIAELSALDAPTQGELGGE